MKRLRLPVGKCGWSMKPTSGSARKSRPAFFVFEDRDVVKKAGFDALVVKPINAKELVRTITQPQSRE